MNMEPIGTVRNASTEAVDEGWGAVVSDLQVREALAPGLRGLEGFSHVIVLYVMHEADFMPERDLVRRPRGRTDMPEIGIFAQRARHRPNAIGITAVRLLAVEGNIVRVRGLDAIDGTPVLGIKPYYPVYDRVDGATTPEWVDRLMEGYFDTPSGR